MKNCIILSLIWQLEGIDDLLLYDFWSKKSPLMLLPHGALHQKAKRAKLLFIQCAYN